MPCESFKTCWCPTYSNIVQVACRCFSLDPRRSLWIPRMGQLRPSASSLAHDAGWHRPSTSKCKAVWGLNSWPQTNAQGCRQYLQWHTSRYKTTCSQALGQPFCVCQNGWSKNMLLEMTKCVDLVPDPFWVYQILGLVWQGDIPICTSIMAINVMQEGTWLESYLEFLWNFSYTNKNRQKHAITQQHVRCRTHILFALDGIHKGGTQGRILIFGFIYPPVPSNVELDIT